MLLLCRANDHSKNSRIIAALVPGSRVDEMKLSPVSKLPQRAGSQALAVLAAASIALHVGNPTVLAFPPGPPLHASMLLADTPAAPLSEAELVRMSEANSKLTDKSAQKLFNSGVELASRGADPETQTRDDEALRKAEERFTLLVEEASVHHPTPTSHCSPQTDRNSSSLA